MMNGIFLMLGGNLGEVAITFSRAVTMLSEANIQVLRSSALYRTKAWPDASQPDYLNQALEVSWNGSPEALLSITQSIETALGRVRSIRNANRTLDIDLVLWGDKVLKTELLEIPHPRMQERMFVLAPLCEIAPEFMHPKLQRTLTQLRDLLTIG